MRRYIPGLHSRQQTVESNLDGLFLVRVEKAFYRWHPQKPWFLRDFEYDRELLSRDQIDEKALLGLRGVIRTSHTALNGRSYQNLDGFAPAAEWEERSSESINESNGNGHADDL
jgi:hypothetical protein